MSIELPMALEVSRCKILISVLEELSLNLQIILVYFSRSFNNSGGMDYRSANMEPADLPNILVK